MEVYPAVPDRRLSEPAVRALSILTLLLLSVLLLALLVIEPGRWRGQEHTQTYYPEPVARPGYTLDHQFIGANHDIAAYILSRKRTSTEPRPAVILIHGGAIVDALETSRAQYKGEWLIPHFQDIPYSLAENGILVVMIDAWWAGERHRPEHDDLAKADPVAAVFRGYVETTRDVSHVIDYLSERDDVAPGRIGVAGKSGGGIISLMAACAEERLEVVVSWNAGADFIETTRSRGQGLLLKRTLDSDSGFVEEVRAADPIYEFERIPPKAVALLGNLEDPAMPRRAAEGLHAKLLPLYESFPERLLLKLFVTPQPTHDVQAEAFTMGCEWLTEHLLAATRVEGVPTIPDNTTTSLSH